MQKLLKILPLLFLLSCQIDVKTLENAKPDSPKPNNTKIPKAKSDNVKSGKIFKFIDNRDGQKYKAKKLKDGSVWMLENLNFKIASGSHCYKKEKSNCDKYGSLYSGVSLDNICPKGWHLPSEKEWFKMVKAYGGASTGSFLDLPNQPEPEDYEESFWKLNDDGFFTKLTGFGQVFSSGLGFKDMNKVMHFWTSTETVTGQSVFYTFSKGIFRQGYKEPEALFYNCRCVKD